MDQPKTSTDEFQSHDFGQDMLQRTRTAGSVSMSAEMFEKLYVSPENRVKGQLRKTFGNPTPIALVGFVIGLTPLSCDLMGWRGAGGSGAAGMGTYYFFGGFMQVLGGLLEWVLGNTFPSVVFVSFGAFFLSFAATLTPSFAAFQNYAPIGEDPKVGLTTQGFNASFAFFTLFMALLCVVYLICSLRTNICFVIVFFTLILAFVFFSVVYWLLAMDYTANAALATKFQQAAGGACFVCCAAGWWVLFAQMLASVDFPYALPVGDLSTVVPSGSSREAARASRESQSPA